MLPPPTIQQRVEVIRKHLYKSVEWKGETLGILEMRRHYTNYLKGYPNIKEYRTKLVTLQSLPAIDEVLQEIELAYTGVSVQPGKPVVNSEYAECCGG
jgi:tRNA-dihydrouridine synthase